MLTAATTTVDAQTNGSNSSYSRFGLGTLSSQAQGFNQSMAGVAQGIRMSNVVNMQNPASYAAIDSLTFLFDVGMSLQNCHMKNGKSSLNARNASFGFVNAAYRIRRGLGMSFGFVPYTSIGYNFEAENRVGTDLNSNQPIVAHTTYAGDGGLNQMYVGLGWNPVAKLNIGMNISYLWGSYSHALAQTFYEGTTASSNYSKQNAVYDASVSSYKWDIGVQYPIRISRRDWLTMGATVGVGHSLHADATMNRYTSAGDTLKHTAQDAFSIPMTYSGGIMWRHKYNLMVAADYSLQKWAGCRVPMAVSQGTDLTYTAVTDQYTDRQKFAVGAEYIINPESYKYMDRVRFRAGVSYTSPYVKVNGHDGPSEYTATAGVGLPISKRIYRAPNSIINVGVQWTRRKPSASHMISENYFMLNLGFTFNEGWFAKWKIE